MVQSSVTYFMILQFALLNISSRAASKIPVFIQNVTDQSVILQPKHILGEVSAAVSVTSLGSEQSSSLPSDCPSESHANDLTFDLDNPLLGDESNARITTKLNFI